MDVEFLAGVRSQPDNLARSAAALRGLLDSGAGERLARDAGRGALLAFGMGASAHAATAFAALLRAAGRPVLACSAADLLGGTPGGLAAGYLAVTQSGRSRETVEALAALPRGTRIAVTNDPGAPVAGHAEHLLPLSCGPDTRVSTLSYTVTLQALGLLADRITGAPPADWAALPPLAASVLDTEPEPLVDALSGAAAVDVVGAGIRAGSAGAVALLLREAAGLPATAYPTREYLHGPLETAGPGRCVLVFGSGRDAALAGDLTGWGARVVLVTADPAAAGPHVLRLPAAPGLAGCVLDILPVQVAAHRLAERAGRPIELRHMPADTKLTAP
jgi:glucosamine--fructose-6-phosphate aminotransferase (isomerizing)